MRNKLLLSALALLLLPLAAFAQDWEEWQEVEAPYALEYVDRIHSGGIVHGIVVDNNDYVWINNHGSDEGLHVVDLEGNPAPFSPISSVTIDGTEYPTTTFGRGIAKDQNGNIMATYNHSQLFHINASTGEGIAMWEGPGSLTSPAVDSDGFVYIGSVVSSPPIFVLDSETGLTETFQITHPDLEYLSRATAATPDGSTVISARIGASAGLYFFTSEDLTNYEVTDSTHVFDGDPTAVELDPEGMLWATDEGEFPTDPGFSTRNLKVFDIENRTYYSLTHDSLDINPRGVGFHYDGETKQIVVGSFGTGYTEVFNLVDPGSVAIDDPEQPQEFTLEQNFPNPFNPTTTIRYSLRQAGEVTLRVYNATGQLVQTLVSGPQASGTHQATWDGTDANGRQVSSGVYFYSLEMENRRETRAMTFLK